MKRWIAGASAAAALAFCALASCASYNGTKFYGQSTTASVTGSERNKIYRQVFFVEYKLFDCDKIDRIDSKIVSRVNTQEGSLTTEHWTVSGCGAQRLYALMIRRDNAEHYIGLDYRLLSDTGNAPGRGRIRPVRPGSAPIQLGPDDPIPFDPNGPPITIIIPAGIDWDTFDGNELPESLKTAPSPRLAPAPARPPAPAPRPAPAPAPKPQAQSAAPAPAAPRAPRSAFQTPQAPAQPGNGNLNYNKDGYFVPGAGVDWR